MTGMTGWLALCVAAVGLATASAGAQQMPEAVIKSGIAATGLKLPRTEIELGHGKETLTNNLPDWTSTYLLASRQFGERKTLYGGLRETRRFGLDDTEVHAGLYYPLAATWTSLLEASASPTHEVLARYSVYGELQKNLGSGWGVGLGLRHNEYSLIGTNVLSGAISAALTRCTPDGPRARLPPPVTGFSLTITTPTAIPSACRTATAVKSSIWARRAVC